jgi:hypothetical protein
MGVGQKLNEETQEHPNPRRALALRLNPSRGIVWHRQKAVGGTPTAATETVALPEPEIRSP